MLVRTDSALPQPRRLRNPRHRPRRNRHLQRQQPRQRRRNQPFPRRSGRTTIRTVLISNSNQYNLFKRILRPPIRTTERGLDTATTSPSRAPAIQPPPTLRPFITYRPRWARRAVVARIRIETNRPKIKTPHPKFKLTMVEKGRKRRRKKITSTTIMWS